MPFLEIKPFKQNLTINKGYKLLILNKIAVFGTYLVTIVHRDALSEMLEFGYPRSFLKSMPYPQTVLSLISKKILLLLKPFVVMEFENLETFVTLFYSLLDCIQH